ncbi:MAG: hypothetical protein RLZZ197_1345 [Bacteroidota bacterium]
MRNQPIYLDYAATTPVHPDVLSAMLPYFTEIYGNAGSSSHLYGWRASEAVEQSRNTVASYFQVKPAEVVFTSGATESINLGIRGYLQGKPKGHLITSALEHKAVLEVFHALENEGWEVTYIKEVSELASVFRPDTALVSLMLVNNELGSILPYQDVLKLCEARDVCFHSDATQALGKMELDLNHLPHLISFSGHKIYGPKGIGGLPVPLIVGLAKAMELIPEFLSKSAFYKASIEKLKTIIPADSLNTPTNSVPSILNFTLKGADWERMFQVLNALAFSNGSAF